MVSERKLLDELLYNNTNITEDINLSPPLPKPHKTTLTASTNVDNIDSFMKLQPSDISYDNIKKSFLSDFTFSQNIRMLVYMFLLFILVNTVQFISLLPKSMRADSTTVTTNSVGTVVQGAVYILFYIIIYIIVSFNVV
jgi:hypothetical protein